MSVAIVETVTKAESTGTTGLTIGSHTTSGADRLLVVGVASWRATGDNTPSGVVFNTSEALTLVSDSAQSPDNEQANMWRRIAPSVATANVVVSFASSSEVVAAAISLTGAHQTTPEDDVDSAVSTANTTTSGLTLTSQTGGLCLDALSLFNPGTTTPAVGQDLQWAENNTSAAQSGFGSSEAGAASVTMTWTWANSRDFAHVAIAIAPAAGAGGGFVPSPRGLDGGMRALRGGLQ